MNIGRDLAGPIALAKHFHKIVRRAELAGRRIVLLEDSYRIAMPIISHSVSRLYRAHLSGSVTHSGIGIRILSDTLFLLHLVESSGVFALHLRELVLAAKAVAGLVKRAYLQVLLEAE